MSFLIATMTTHLLPKLTASFTDLKTSISADAGIVTDLDLHTEKEHAVSAKVLESNFKYWQRR